MIPSLIRIENCVSFHPLSWLYTRDRSAAYLDVNVECGLQVHVVANLLFWIAAAIIVVFAFSGLQRDQPRAPATPSLKVDWHKIRHLWLED